MKDPGGTPELGSRVQPPCLAGTALGSVLHGGDPVPGPGSPQHRLCSRVVGEENFTMKGSLLKVSVPHDSQPSS